MIRARIRETDALNLAEEALDELMPTLEAATQRAAQVIVTEAQLNLRKRQGSRGTASPAGEPPEMDEGDLLRSVKAGRTRKTKYSVRTEYGSEHPAAGLHEFGGTVTKGGAKRTYPPRPYMRPAEESSRAEVDRIVDGVL